MKKQKRVDSKSYFESKNIITPPKTLSKPPLHPPPPLKPPGVPAMAPQARESYRDQIINLLSKIQRFWQLQTSRIIALTLVLGRDTILYTTDNWDISAAFSKLLSSWSSMTAQFIMISGIEYSILQCTSELLVTSSIKGKDHILVAKDEEYILILQMETNGLPREDGYAYIFTHPKPHDDFEPAPQSQIRNPLKNKSSENETYCQY